MLINYLKNKKSFDESNEKDTIQLEPHLINSKSTSLLQIEHRL